MKKIAIFDLDGTIIFGQSQIYLLIFLYQKKIIGTGRFIIIFFYYLIYKLGISKNLDKLMKKIYSSFRFEKNEFDSIIRLFYLQILSKKVNTKVIKILKQYQHDNYYTILSTASIDPIAEIVSLKYGFNDYISTKLEIVEGSYTGRIVGFVNYGEYKLKGIIKTLKLTKRKISECVYVGDHISDLPVFNLSGKPIAISPKNNLKKIFEQNKWEIVR